LPLPKAAGAPQRRRRRRRPQCRICGAEIAPCSPLQQPPLLRTHNKQCGARAGSANRLNRRLNRHPPGTARRAGACSSTAYPRCRALPAPGPRSRFAAAATSSARVSGSSVQRRRLRRLLPWWRSRLRSSLRRRRRRRRRARDAAEHAYWSSQGAGPAAAGERKARPSLSAGPFHARSAAPESAGQRPLPLRCAAACANCAPWSAQGAHAGGGHMHLRTDAYVNCVSAPLLAPGPRPLQHLSPAALAA
jgi:hypothetical protein